MNSNSFVKLAWVVFLWSVTAMSSVASHQAWASSSSHHMGHMPGDKVMADTPAKPAGPGSLAVMLRGVDKVVASWGVGPNDNQLNSIDYRQATSTVTDAVRELFRNANFYVPVSSIQIKSLNEISDAQQERQYERPNVLLVTFVLSARQETVAGKPIEVAALTWMFRRFDSALTFSGSGDGVSYPFVIPDTKDDLMKRIHDGVLYLAPNLPERIACANKISPDCPDCAVTECPMVKEYLERPASNRQNLSPALKVEP